PTLIEITGNDYLKSAVDERFSLSNTKATWKNNEEQGEKSLSGKAYYLSVTGVPEELALLAQALLATPNKKLALLPEGEAQIARIGELKIEANGQSRTVVQYDISGIDFVPSPIWLDQDRKFFASVSSWATVIREGWEESAAALLKAQDAAESVRT